MIAWKSINSTTGLATLLETSQLSPLVLFKHSTRCSISAMVLARLEKSSPTEEVDWYLIPVIEQRVLSNEIEFKTGVRHESPQVLIIHKGSCIFFTSHTDIRMEDIELEISKLRIQTEFPS